VGIRGLRRAPGVSRPEGGTLASAGAPRQRTPRITILPLQQATAAVAAPGRYLAGASTVGARAQPLPPAEESAVPPALSADRARRSQPRRERPGGGSADRASTDVTGASRRSRRALTIDPFVASPSLAQRKDEN